MSSKFSQVYFFPILASNLGLVQAILFFPRGASFGLLTAVAIPLDLSPQNVYLSFNFESNYALPSNDSYNQWIDRWDLDEQFLGVGSNVTPINGRHGGAYDQTENELTKRSAPPPLKRYDFYRSIINYLAHFGFNGTACLLRTICEVSESPLDAHNGVLGSIFQILFMPTTSVEEMHLRHVNGLYEASDMGQLGLGCSNYVANCEHNLLDLISIVI